MTNQGDFDMKTRTAGDWAHILDSMGVRPAVFAAWAPVFADTIKPGTFSAGDKDLQDFLAQIIHESKGLTRLSEDLYYSAERMTEVWPHRFPTIESAQPYARNPEALANKTYGGRMGNTRPGDGWKFRGRSPIMLTGYNNYAKVGKLVGQDLTVMPELLEQPHFALEACIAWWEDDITDDMLGDPELVSLHVNGGLIGLAARVALTDRAGRALA
jgi:putative chitinase